METIYVHDGIGYFSKDLAILKGADALSLYEIKLNDTNDDDIEFIVDTHNVEVVDNEDSTLIPTNQDLNYFDVEFNTKQLSKYTRVRLEDALQDFAVNYEPYDFND